MTSELFIFILRHRWPWRLLIIGLSFLGALAGIMGPYFQKHFIDSLLTVPSTDFFGFENTLTPLTLVFIAFCCVMVNQSMSLLTNYLGMKEAVLLQKILSDRIYEKTLQLRTDSLQNKTVGEIVSIYASDVMGATIFVEQSLPAGAATLFPLILAPLGLYWLFAIPLQSILIVMLLVITINSWLALRQSVFFTRFKQLAAERLGLVNEWIVNIKILRLLGWIESFEAKIKTMRETETRNRVAMVTNGQTMNSISSTATFIINVVALIALVHTRGTQVTPGELLSLLWIVGIFLVRPFRQLPWFFTFGFDGWTSLKRIANFLMIQNQGRDWPHAVSTHETSMETEGPLIEVRNLRLSIKGTKLLHNINFQIEPCEFVAVVGEVGSGKSLLLLSLMGETGAEMDLYRINNRNVLSASHGELCRHFAYVPQEGFVMSATLRDNIAFDYQVSNKLDARITHCLSLAQFSGDQEQLPDQLDTEIGERGVNLSGGQKQRVSLARADYYDCPIILLDDSLSALDVNTEKLVLDALIKGRWAKKTRILATHRLSVLRNADRILFLHEGQLLAQGSFLELIRNSETFRRFLESLEIEQQNEIQN